MIKITIINGKLWEYVGESGSMDLTGVTNVLLDEKYRITLPAELRKELNTTDLKITQGEDFCLWLYTVEKWNEIIGDPIKLKTKKDPFSIINRRLVDKFISPSEPVFIDKVGRIVLPENLRNYAGITKECVVVGAIDHIAIWDAEKRKAYCDPNNEKNAMEYAAASEEMSQMIKSKMDVE